MENRGLKLQDYPTTAELYAVECAAKAARSAELARLVTAAARSVKSLFAPTEHTKGLKHA